MAYSTQNMYQMFDIIPNFVKKMFPFSLKSYPSCTNTMAWDIRDEIRSAYILRMVHQRDNQNTITDGNANKRNNIFSTVVEKDGCHCSKSSKMSTKKELLFNKSNLFTPLSSQSEDLLCITIMDRAESMPKSASEVSTKKSCRNIRNKSKCLYQKNYHNVRPQCKASLSGQTIQLVMSSTSKISIQSRDNSPTLADSSPKSVVKRDQNSTVRREYQLLAQKFHQYTMNCRTTIRTLEKKLKKLIDDKHALLHGMVSMRKGQKDVVKKYRKIFNDAMNEHCNEINDLLANYKVIRDNYLELLEHETSLTNTSPKEAVISVSYTSYNCC